MFKIELHGLNALRENVDDLIKNDIPYITARTLTETARKLKEATPAKLEEVFDRPNRWTLGGVFSTSASKDNLTAHVGFKDESAMKDSSRGIPAAWYLNPGVYGGPRNLKRYEKALQRFGVLPQGYYTVPGAGVKLDRYGNISTGTITEILTGIGALTGMSDTKYGGVLGGYKRRKKTTANFFVVTSSYVKGSGFVRGRGGLVPGIWQRMSEKGAGIRGLKGPEARQKGARKGKLYSVIQGRRVRPILIFVKGAPQYKVRFPFYEWADQFVDKTLPGIFNRLAAETLAYHKGRG